MIRTLRPYQLVIDISIALLCVAFRVLVFGVQTPGEAFVIVLMGAALAGYRLSPGIALAVAWAGALLQVGSGLPPDLANAAILAVLYSTARHGSRIVRWVGLASAGVGAVIVSLYMTFVMFSSVGTWPDPGFPAVIFSVVLWFFAAGATLGLSWTVGLLVATWARARDSQRARWEAQRIAVVEQERTRIARDMHDVVAHSLAVVIAQADGARYARAADPEAVDASLLAIASTARAALSDVRLLLTQLRHDQAAGPQPSLADLDALIVQMRTSGLAIDDRRQGDLDGLALSAQLAVYRIVQEALTNALRHGDAEAPVAIRLSREGDVATVVVANGTTTAPRHPAALTIGHGLAGMRERASLVGGSLEVSEADGRFTVTAHIPVAA